MLATIARHMEMNVTSKITCPLLWLVCALVVRPALCIVSADIAWPLRCNDEAFLKHRYFNFAFNPRVSASLWRNLLDRYLYILLAHVFLAGIDDNSDF